MTTLPNLGQARPLLLSGRVATAIERAILDEGLQPGDRLPSGRELTERFGVSRTVVRDALAVLEQRGLVETRPGSGVFVRDGGSEAVSGVLGQMLRRSVISLPELMEARQLLEVHNAVAAARHATAGDLERMETAIAMMAEAVGPQGFVDADVAFHEALAEAAGNRVLTALVGSLRPLLVHGRLIGTALDGAREVAIGDHRAVLAAVRGGDREGASGVMSEHLRHSYDEWARAGYLDLTRTSFAVDDRSGERGAGR